MLKSLDKLIIRAFVGPFFVTFFVVVFILLMQTMLRYFDDFAGKGLSLAIYGELFFYFAVQMTPMAFPLAILLSSLITYGTLGEHRELIAIKSAGISLLRIILPVAFIVIFLSGLSYYINNNVIPTTNLRAYSLLWDIKQKKPSLDLKEGAFYYGLPGYGIKVNEKMPDGVSLRELIIYDHQQGRGNQQMTLADSGRMYTIYDERYLVLELFDGVNYTDQGNKPGFLPNANEFVRSEFGSNRLVFSLASFGFSRTDMELFTGSRRMKNMSQLKVDMDSMDRQQVKIAEGIFNNLRYYYSYQFKKPALDSVIMAMQERDSLIALAKGQNFPRLGEDFNNKSLDLAVSQARNLQSFLENSQKRIQDIEVENNRWAIEWFKKFTQPVACLILFLIGSSHWLYYKKGRAGYSVCYIYYLLYSLLCTNYHGREMDEAKHFTTRHSYVGP